MQANSGKRRAVGGLGETALNTIKINFALSANDNAPLQYRLVLFRSVFAKQTMSSGNFTHATPLDSRNLSLACHLETSSNRLINDPKSA